MSRTVLSIGAAALTLLVTVAPVQAHEPAASRAAPPAAPVAIRCPTAEEAAKVIQRYSEPTAGLPFATAPALKLPESVVAAAMPASMSVGVAASHFRAVWDSLPAWGEVLGVVIKGGSVFEIETRIPEGKPSERSAFFNLGKAALTGHVRADLMGSIHLLEVPSRDGLVRGIFFYGQDGQGIVGYFISGEGREPTAEQSAAFARTRALLQGLPRVCAAPTAGV